MTAAIAYVDICQKPTLYTTRTVVTSASSGVTESSTLPAANIFDRNIGKPLRFTGVDAGDSVRLDIRLVRAGFGPSSTPMGVGLIGLLNVTLRDGSTGLLVTSYPDGAFRVTVTHGNASFADANPSLGSGVQSQSEVGPRNMFVMASDISNAYERNLGGRGDTAVSGAAKMDSYIRILLDDFAGSNMTLDIGRVVFMPLFGGDLAADSYATTLDDPTEVLEAYDGTPYANRRTAKRVISFGFNNIKGSEVTGGSTIAASLQSANLYAGLGDGVVLVPDFTNASFLAQEWGPAFGILSNPMSAQLVRPGLTDPNRLYKVTGTLREVIP